MIPPLAQVTWPALRTLPGATPSKFTVDRLSFFYGKTQALKDVTFDIPERRITAIIGPSGCGKTTLLRVFNRMYDLVPNARAQGSVVLDGEDIITTSKLLPLRQKVGMVFQRPSPFPMSIRDNVAFAPRLLGWSSAKITETVRRSLESAALWDEVSDRLDAHATSLSGGQQQRLVIARCLAVDPQVILMDEPCSALDPVATLKIEDLMVQLARDYTIVIVTHNMQQAARVSDVTAFFLLGRLIETGRTDAIFTAPREKLTQDYVTGRFG